MLLTSKQPSSAQQCKEAETCTRKLGAGDYVNQYLTPSVYDRTLQPGATCSNTTSTPTLVEVQLNIYALNEVEQKRGEITIGAFYRTWWQDHRLAYKDSSEGGCYDSPVMLESDALLWTPNLYVHNLVLAEFGKALTWVYPNGKVWRSDQVQLVTKCELQFHRLPFDVHNCEIVVASYSHGINSVRLVAKNGVVGESVSGDGIQGEGVTSVMWLMEDGPYFYTPGYVEQRYDGQWDYLLLKFKLTRISKFFIQQTIVPDFLFLLLAYVGFWVDPNAAPARAAISVIPVLILRTLANSVYSSIPQISTNVWLCDYLLASMGICCMCTVQFGLVQFALLRERPAAVKFANVKSKKDIVKKVQQEAAMTGLTLIDMLDAEVRHKAAVALEQVKQNKAKVVTGHSVIPKEPSETLSDQEAEQGISFEDDGPGSAAFSSRSTSPKGQSATIAEKSKPRKQISSVTNADLTIVLYAMRMFKLYAPSDGDGKTITVPEIQRCMTRYNLFFNRQEWAMLVCEFLSDKGYQRPERELSAKLTFDDFLEFLVRVDDYMLAIPRPSHVSPFSRSLAPSVRLDILFRWLFPLVVALKIVSFYAVVNTYPASHF